jgi:hypothetical protein
MVVAGLGAGTKFRLGATRVSSLIETTFSALSWLSPMEVTATGVSCRFCSRLLAVTITSVTEDGASPASALQAGVAIAAPMTSEDAQHPRSQVLWRIFPSLNIARQSGHYFCFLVRSVPAEYRSPAGIAEVTGTTFQRDLNVNHNLSQPAVGTRWDASRIDTGTLKIQGSSNEYAVLR